MRPGTSETDRAEAALRPLRRTPGTSTIRMRCPVSGRLIVRQSRLTRSLAGLSGACVAPRTALRPRSQKRSRIANRTIQGAPLYRRADEVPDGGISGPGATKRHMLSSCGMPLRKNAVMSVAASKSIGGKLDRSTSASGGFSAGAHMEAHCRVRLRRKSIASGYAELIDPA